MKKQLKVLMRHKGYTVEISNKINQRFIWKDGSIHNVITGFNITSAGFRVLMGKRQTIEVEDKKNKIIIVSISN